MYINLRESDLVELIGKTRAQGLTPGKDAGIISYNETPLKPFILNGLTTISTDFQLMGELAAGMILDGALSRWRCRSGLRHGPRSEGTHSDTSYI